jgi:hypothetical protein
MIMRADTIIYRWYWLSKSKKSGRKEWIATCWKGHSVDEANEVAQHELYLADVGSKEQKLVKETTSYIAV